MGESGEQLGADLNRMWKVANRILPDLSAEFAAARRAVCGTRSTLAGFPSVPEVNNGLARCASEQPWLDLRDELDKILLDTVDNMNDTATALDMATKAYASTDAAAAAEFDRERDQIGYTPPKTGHLWREDF
ncbi:hypothetical protein [Hamadaea tsunoensis]|uniref:hypothetical protein n=1 Tax=Hamadaea tsunoensis TaxID=53368 RepID=UPI00054E5911|nr:hypothetical protein [Hamadaea tsunoensis]